jgi:hypothetical protein
MYKWVMYNEIGEQQMGVGWFQAENAVSFSCFRAVVWLRWQGQMAFFAV